jgi:SAM-dependent methyltransferase
MARRPLDSDPEWRAIRRMTLVCLMPGGAVALRPDRSLPSDRLRDGEHPLDACRRIPLDQAGFHYQHFHPFALDGDHVYAWADGDRHHTPSVEPLVGVAAADPAERAIVAEAVADHGRLTDEAYYRDNRRTLERAYLRAESPRAQSGFGGDAAAWRARRRQVADAVVRDGTFLDVGCANGHLAESVVGWCAERGVTVEPYGVDIAPGLVALARRRLPRWADRFWVGNAVDWTHPAGMRFDAVHVLLDAVPVLRRADLLRHHLDATVAPGGRLLVSDYAVRWEPRTDAVVAGLGFPVGGWLPSPDPTRPSPGLAWVERPPG